jgi:Fe(3+) dicitrate transport protein
MNFLKLIFFVLLLVLITLGNAVISLYGQSTNQTLTVIIIDNNDNPLEGATVYFKMNKLLKYTNKQGKATFEVQLPDSLVVFNYGYRSKQIALNSTSTSKQTVIRLEELLTESDEIVIQTEQSFTRNFSILADVENMQINAARKSERIKISQLTFNKATNNARQAFAKVAGLNVWESDRSGGQLNIGARGLSPNRTANFNVRQNGYDIAADALGYPESYYTPPMEAVEKIDIVRGAASLQFGTQFGGLLDFKLKRATTETPLIISQSNSVGSFNLRHNFSEFGFKKDGFDLYSFYQYREGDQWRPNGGFGIHTAGISMGYSLNDRTSLRAEYTLLRNLSQQPGGLTDVAFENNARQSIRDRNWFEVHWNLYSFSLNHRFSAKTRFDTRFFANNSSRKALGNLERITVADLGQNRTLLSDEFNNFGNETRFIHTFNFSNGLATWLTGFRIYTGNTLRQQGDGSADADADFNFLNPTDLENSDFTFPSTNYAAFSEIILPVHPLLTVTPGIRFEYIRTQAEGFYRQRVLDFAGNILVDNKIDEVIDRDRSLILAGIGLSSSLFSPLELYANFSQNYRAITFSDLRVANPNFVVDPELQDERGFNFDVGIRGNLFDRIQLDISAFYLRYNNRIGLILKTDEPAFLGEQREIGLPPFFVPYRFRTNIADSRTFGLESLLQFDLKTFHFIDRNFDQFTFFSNLSVQQGQYINTDDLSIRGKEVELVSPLTLRLGFEGKLLRTSFLLQHSYTHQHYSDATNTFRSATAINGIIPSYQVTDLIVSQKLSSKLLIELGIQNLFNEIYFTRRAEGYPGPGIIPSDPRNGFLRIEYKW